MFKICGSLHHEDFLPQTFYRSQVVATRLLTMSVTLSTLGPGTRWRVFSSVRHSSTCICSSLITWSCSVRRSTSSTQRPILYQYGPLHPSDCRRDVCKDQAHRVLYESKTVTAQTGASLSNRPDWTAVLSSKSVLSTCTLIRFHVEGFILDLFSFFLFFLRKMFVIELVSTIKKNFF